MKRGRLGQLLMQRHQVVPLCNEMFAQGVQFQNAVSVRPVPYPCFAHLNERYTLLDATKALLQQVLGP